MFFLVLGGAGAGDLGGPVAVLRGSSVLEGQGQLGRPRMPVAILIGPPDAQIVNFLVFCFTSFERAQDGGRHMWHPGMARLQAGAMGEYIII
eukprot:9500583-Pyramimonas_sp.AAC.1